MTTKTKTKWRLSNLPTPAEVSELFVAGLLTKDEAREILISLETEEDRTKKSLQEEIKFLRELVAKLTANRSVILESIRYIEKPYRQYEWYQPYYQYATTAGTTSLTYSSGSAVNALNNLSSVSSGGGVSALAVQQSQQQGSASFTGIKTF